MACISTHQCYYERQLWLHNLSNSENRVHFKSLLYIYNNWYAQYKQCIIKVLQNLFSVMMSCCKLWDSMPLINIPLLVERKKHAFFPSQFLHKTKNHYPYLAQINWISPLTFVVLNTSIADCNTPIYPGKETSGIWACTI